MKGRLEELEAFQAWTEQAHNLSTIPFIVRTHVLAQNYICFVYLPEACFRILAKVCPSGSAAKKCARFLCNNPVRSFRNAIAHANWTYRDDFGGIIYWAKKGDDPEEPLKEFEVTQDDLEFWQALSKCVAYVVYLNL